MPNSKMSSTELMIKEGFKAWFKDREKAKYWMRRAADSGDPEGMFRMGVILRYEDAEESVYWCEKASCFGHGGAMNLLGVIYMDDSYDGQDLLKSKEWFEKSINHGYISSKLGLESVNKKIAAIPTLIKP